jgi:hypothetical protein
MLRGSLAMAGVLQYTARATHQRREGVMDEIILEMATELRGRNGVRYSPRACGRKRSDGLWEGWLEFVPLDGGTSVVTDRETTQPSRDTLAYWASGLTDPYLDGALLRALTPAPAPRAAGGAVHAAPPARGPAASPARGPAASPARDATASPRHSSASPTAVLDPFHVHAEGADLLRSQLGALDAAQLRNIIRAYSLSELDYDALAGMTKPELRALIVARVEKTAGE